MISFETLKTNINELYKWWIFLIKISLDKKKLNLKF